MDLHLDVGYELVEGQISFGLILKHAAAAGDAMLPVVDAKTISPVACFERTDVAAVLRQPQYVAEFGNIVGGNKIT